MGVAPYKTFTFDGVSSADYDVYLTGVGVYNAPKRSVEMLSIAGRNGDYALDQGKFENVSVTYRVGMYDTDENNFATKVSNFRNWLCSKVGYVRLEDEYNPNEYRMAVYADGFELDHDMLIAGEAEIEFNCKPQRWLTSGETAVTIGEWGETETVSGEVVEVEATDTDAVKSLVADINPIQDLNGYDKPWVGGAGKNLLNVNALTLQGGVTITTNNNRVTIVADGTSSTYQSVYWGGSTNLKLPAGTYYIKGKLVSNSNTALFSRIGLRNSSNSYVLSTNLQSTGEFSVSGTTTVDTYFSITVNGAETTRNVTVVVEDIMLSTADSAFEPYENICPISGYTEVDVVRTGKNLIPNSATTETQNGLTFTVNSDGSVKVTGTASADTVCYMVASASRALDAYLIDGQSYTLTGCPNGGGNSTYSLQVAYGGSTWQQDNGSGKTFTYSSLNGNALCRILIKSGQALGTSGITFYPMVRFSSVTDTTYEPYNANTYTTALGRTVYGGTLDLVSGILTVDRIAYTVGGLSWDYDSAGTRFITKTSVDLSQLKAPTSSAIPAENSISSAYELLPQNVFSGGTNPNGAYMLSTGTRISVRDTRYTTASDFTTNMGTAQLVFALATPQTYQLTPQQVQLLKGTDNIWSSSGDITVEYGHNPMVLVNPTPFEAEPLLAMKGYGNISINSQTVSVSNSEIGKVILNNGTTLPTNGIVSLDAANLDLMETGDTITILSGSVITQGLTMATGSDIDAVTSMSISITGGSITAHINSVPSSGGGKLVQLVVDSPITFSKGTGETKSIPLSVTATYKVNGTTSTYTGTYSNDFRYSAQYNRIDIMLSDKSPTLPASLYTYAPLGASKCSEITGYSTKTTISDDETIYIDLSIGEAYTDNSGVISSVNNIVSLGSDLPKLASGANTFTYDNTVTELNVTPRYWKV